MGSGRETSADRRATWRRGALLGSAAVWLHQGLWCKALDRSPSHRAIVGTLPGPLGSHAVGLTRALGATEVGLAALVATNGRRRWVAVVETIVVVGCNTGGLVLGRRHIAHPGRLLARNGAFLALVWIGVG